MHNTLGKEEQAFVIHLLRSIIDYPIWFTTAAKKVNSPGAIGLLSKWRVKRKRNWGSTPHQSTMAGQVVMSNEVLESNASIRKNLAALCRRSQTLLRNAQSAIFDPKGNRLGLLAFGQDITERKQAADAVNKASKEKPPLSPLSVTNCARLLTVLLVSRMLRDTQLTRSNLTGWAR